ncbi:MAG TPA: hypothetical protein VFC16_07180 [Nakamurella sp.]|nr:hypothetical protein [Nakamurella sp.]
MTRKVKLPRRNEPQREIRAWSDEQVTAFLAHPATAASPLRSIFIAAFSTGMRRSELLGLTPADLRLNVAKPHLFVRRSLHQGGAVDVPKSDRSRRRLPLSQGIGRGRCPAQSPRRPRRLTAARTSTLAGSRHGSAALAEPGEQGVPGPW